MASERERMDWLLTNSEYRELQDELATLREQIQAVTKDRDALDGLWQRTYDHDCRKLIERAEQAERERDAAEASAAFWNKAHRADLMAADRKQAELRHRAERIECRVRDLEVAVLAWWDHDNDNQLWTDVFAAESLDAVEARLRALDATPTREEG